MMKTKFHFLPPFLRFKNLAIGKRMMFGFILIVALFLSINVVSYGNLNTFIKGANLERHTLEVLESLEHILISLIDAETGQRGYLLIGDKKYLEPYNAGIESVFDEIEDIAQLTVDNPNQQQRIVELKNLVEKKTDELQETIDLYADGNVEGALEIVMSARGKIIMDDIRALLEEMEAEERELLVVRHNRTSQSQSITKAIIIFGSLAGFIISFVIILFITRSIVTPIATARSAAIEITRGNMDIEIETSGKDEIAELGEAFNTMTKKLKETMHSLETQKEELAIKVQEADEQNRAVLNIMEDLEDAKGQIEEEAQNAKKFQQAVEASTDAVVITSPQLEFLYVNPAWQELTGYREEEALGKKPEMLVSENMDAAHYKEMEAKAAKGEAFHSEEFLYKRKDGSEYSAKIKMYPVGEEKKPTFYVILHEDITQRKRADAAKTEFVSLASHQLRTPLTTIKWVFEMFNKGKAGKLTKSQKDLLGDAQKCAQHLGETIKTMLTISRIEAGKIHLNVADIQLNSLLEEIDNEQKAMYEKKKHTVSYSCPKNAFLHTDPGILKEIVSNILSNAIKYTPAKGTITVHVKKVEDTIHIDVADTGHGIPKQQQDKIFTKFFRADNVVSLETDGTGLGLYLVHSLVTLLKGKITFASAEEKGTTFSLIFPLSSPHHEESSDH